MKSVSIYVFLAITLVACAVLVPRIPFPEHEYAQLKKEGNATVKGQVFMKTVGGDIKYGAGEIALLNPVTSYSRQWYEVSYLGGSQMAAYDPRLVDYLKAKRTNASGQFEFKKVPAGDYYVVSRVTWKANPDQIFPEGGDIAQKITVNDNEEVEVILTR